jgi:hypothetical protein
MVVDSTFWLHPAPQPFARCSHRWGIGISTLQIQAPRPVGFPFSSTRVNQYASLRPPPKTASCSSTCPCTPFLDLPSAKALKRDLRAGAWAAISVLFGLGLPLVLHGACLYAGVSSLAVSYSPLPSLAVCFSLVWGLVLTAWGVETTLLTQLLFFPLPSLSRRPLSRRHLFC